MIMTQTEAGEEGTRLELVQKGLEGRGSDGDDPFQCLLFFFLRVGDQLGSINVMGFRTRRL